MNHDPSNPFYKLAKAFTARKETGERPVRGQSASAKPHARDEGEADDDAALFLDAVSSIKPLEKTKMPKDSPGERLADRMRSNRRGTGMTGRDTTPGNAPDAKRGLAGHASGRNTDRTTCQITGQTGRRTTSPMGSLPGGRAERTDGPDNQAGSSTKARPHAQPDGFPKHQAPGASFSSTMRDLFSESDEEPTREEDVLFAKAMHGVSPVIGKGRDVTVPAGQTRAVPAHDPAKALRDVLKGRVEFALHHTDEFMEGYVVGVDPLVLARLRGGQYSLEKHLDMHGMNARQAYDALTWFIRDAYQRGMRCVVVVTGRGRNSPDGIGVLRPMLQRWLSREPFKRVVLAFCTARPGDGGPGASYVLLRKYKKSRGKIIWDHTSSDEDFPDM